MPIRRLDPSVVNRIAAGEIIIQPSNALKELLENSIDAGATSVEILVKDGGLKLLQITDNGCGIPADDMPLLCERFATSKLTLFIDLASLATYGFRGEALASISHIARLSVISKTPETQLAYKAYYANGKLASPKFKAEEADKTAPKPVAGKNGTQITVEDLFYNVPARLRAMKLKSDEWALILDVVGKYAVHTAGVGFSCKKFGDSNSALSTRPQAELKERLRTVFGVSVASDIIEFSKDGPYEDYGLLKVSGAITGLNYNNKRRAIPVFFINNRLVTCDPLKRAILSLYQVFLPKGSYPFFYLSLEIKPENVDVNIHPTKREVRFLHEDEIIEWIAGLVHTTISSQDTSRTFRQSTFKRVSENVDDVTTLVKKYRQENKLVRVDASQPKLEAFVNREPRNINTILQDAEFDEEEESTSNRREVELDSILDLRQELLDLVHRPLTNVFNNLVYVGVVDGARRLCLFQYDVKLFLCDYAAVLTDFFYQIGLAEFANFGRFDLKPAVPMHDILGPLYDKHDGLVPREQVVATITSMAEMFKEYFEIDVREGKLHSLPLLLPGAEPALSKLHFFLYRLGAKVDYNDEKTCLSQILRQIALLYVPAPVNLEDHELNIAESSAINEKLENVIFPALRLRFVASSNLADYVVQLADLPGLYKVFERC